MDRNEKINAVIRTLNTLSVSGKENLSKLLGCIAALEEVTKEEISNAGQSDT